MTTTSFLVIAVTLSIALLILVPIIWVLAKDRNKENKEKVPVKKPNPRKAVKHAHAKKPPAPASKNHEQDDDTAKSNPLGDERPNSGLRAGKVSHHEVNEAIRRYKKYHVIGFRSHKDPYRHRTPELIQDLELDRRTNPELDQFISNVERDIPDFFRSALMAANVSVTLVDVRNDSSIHEDKLVYLDTNRYQQFHTGRTRRTIYMPYKFVSNALGSRNDTWAVVKSIVVEAIPLLDYILLCDCYDKAKEYWKKKNVSTMTFSVAVGFIKELDNIRQHLSDPMHGNNAHGTFSQHYWSDISRWNASMKEQNHYDIADSMFSPANEALERAWASSLVMPVMAADLIGTMCRSMELGQHDDASGRLPDLLQLGAYGIKEFLDRIVLENTSGSRKLTKEVHGKSNLIDLFKIELWKHADRTQDETDIVAEFDRLVLSRSEDTDDTPDNRAQSLSGDQKTIMGNLLEKMHKHPLHNALLLPQAYELKGVDAPAIAPERDSPSTTEAKDVSSPG